MENSRRRGSESDHNEIDKAVGKSKRRLIPAGNNPFSKVPCERRQTLMVGGPKFPLSCLVFVFAADRRQSISGNMRRRGRGVGRRN
jgi:hypothetical protein